MATPIIAREGTGGKGTRTGEASCGCRVERGRIVQKCAEGLRLWDVLLRARDEMDEHRAKGEKRGHKARYDAFAAARQRYHDHCTGRAA